MALASVDDTTSLGEISTRLCRPTRRNGRRFRAPNSLAAADAARLEVISPGEFCINGLRNRNSRPPLFGTAPVSMAQRRQAAAVTRKLALPRAHRLIRKVPHTHRYLLTDAGRVAVAALITARNADTQELTKMVA